MGLTEEEMQRVKELHAAIDYEEHNGKPGTFNRKLISLYREMQTLYRKQSFSKD